MSWIQQIDFMILEWIQSHLQGAALDLLMPTITALGNGGWLFILLALVLLLSKRYRRQGCALAVSLLLCLLVGNLFLKPLFARLRPFEVAGLSELLISPPTDYSFPSGHTMASFACAGSGVCGVVLVISAAAPEQPPRAVAATAPAAIPPVAPKNCRLVIVVSRTATPPPR